MRVLVMSPSAAARRLLELLLGSMGHACSAAEDGDEVLAALREVPSGVVLVDARSGSEDAMFLSGLLQKRHPSVPRLVLQAGELRLVSAGEERVLRFSNEGGAAFPSKDCLARALALVESERQLAALRPAAAKA